MKTLYFDCQMGAAGDMITAALLDLFDKPEDVVNELNQIGISGVEFSHSRVEKSGISGLQVTVKVNGVEEVCEDVKAHFEHHRHDEHAHAHPCHNDHPHIHCHKAHHHNPEHGDAPHHCQGEHHHHSHEMHAEMHQPCAFPPPQCDMWGRPLPPPPCDVWGRPLPPPPCDMWGRPLPPPPCDMWGRPLPPPPAPHFGQPCAFEPHFEPEHHHKHPHCHDHEHTHCHEHEHHCHDHEQHCHDHEHHHASMAEINAIIDGLKVNESVKADVRAIYGIIAEAESHAHGVPVTEVHFHEVGAMDAVADITAACFLIHKLAPTQILCSPIHVGSGHVHCAHGILPVPAPATAYILRGIPSYGGEVSGELCTPTGAAIVKHFATKFCHFPVMSTERLGYGMGKKAFDRPNCVRSFIGNTESNSDTVCELSCNIDDMSAEALGFAQERLLEAGALDVFSTAVIMKKSRPGYMLTVLCSVHDHENVLKALFTHTSTIGVREKICHRYVLAREFETVSLPEGDVRIKKSTGYGVERIKPEYEDIARIARARGVSLKDIEDEVIHK